MPNLIQSAWGNLGTQNVPGLDFGQDTSLIKRARGLLMIVSGQAHAFVSQMKDGTYCSTVPLAGHFTTDSEERALPTDS